MIRLVNVLAVAIALDIAYEVGRLAGATLAGLEDGLRRAAR